MTESAAELHAGQVFAGWQVERELARGGMGVLYLARHPRLPRTDVIKVLSPHLSANTRFRERFLREASRMSTMSHPHVMPIHDSGETEDGTLYLVMPYIAGGDLRHLLRDHGPLPPARAVRLIEQLAAALDAAHRIGVVHRDVKPENVLLASVEPNDPDHALLTDFGISREEMSATTLTATGELLLTPAYAAPEQVLGKPLDARVDQYALGCMLYELLAGRPPYLDDAPVVMLMAHIQEPVPSLAYSGLPPAIDEVLSRAMAKAPERRYASCRELAKAAAAALGLPVTVTTLPGAPQSPPAPRVPPAESMPPAAAAPKAPPHPPTPPTRQPAPPTQPLPAGSAPPPHATPLQSAPPPAHRSRKQVIGIVAAVAVLGGAGAAAAVLAGGGGSNASATAAYTDLLQRIPTAVRPTCADASKQLPNAEKPYVATRAACFPTVSGRKLTVVYRTLNGDQQTINRYRTTVLGLGGTHHSPGNCMTFQSTDPNLHGSDGFGQLLDSPPLVGPVWCGNDGTFWYLQSDPATGGRPIMTHLSGETSRDIAQAPQRFADLQAVAPSR